MFCEFLGLQKWFKQVFDEHKNKQKVYGLFRGISRSDFSKEKSRNRTP
ncbi:hypothetical protein HanXRQr2_Chr02g0075601 [Helianthus annuus]|uniref:Uncharacterized protein n=1 Tax=Helianthus annuus TaxID=4232 RepID=A0A9K3JQS0_HELAN|nr:hypothetical protein HanXRQr2_Chr02g0075601 [Helianthus annuus]KAJ0811976.1 hypothetical protein HanPSC8_Chr17g0756721 [Helianthus annuus]